MQYYCENCHMLSEHDFCDVCGKNQLRSPVEDDFCFLIEKEILFAEMFKGMLEGESIPFAEVPSGNWMRTIFALGQNCLKIYIPYKFFSKAKEMLDEVVADIAEKESRNLLENLDKLFVSPRNERKIKKVIKLGTDDDLVAYCVEIIKNADSFVNKGKIIDCLKGGMYFFFYKDTDMVVVNSATYEILSAGK